jgi:predicted regulator of Ras-like GTPase activity (Roadblock/LC7/MglB family)
MRVLPKAEALKPIAAPRQTTPAKPVAAPKVTPAAKPAATPPSAAPAAKPATKAKSEPASKPAPATSAPAAPAFAATAPATPTSPSSALAATAPPNTLLVPLLELARNWPESLRQEIVQLGPTQCAFPLAELGDALKLGKAEFPWSKIFSWIHPCPTKSCSPANAETMVELPINLIAPLYINKTRTATAQKKVAVPDAVPELFGKGGQPPPSAPAAAAAPPAKPSAARRTAAPPASAESETKNLAIGLADLWQNWPEAIRKEIDHLNLAVLPLQLPLDVIEMGLRQGKVDFLWKQICSWVQNCPPAAPSAANADVRLELPLPVLAPLFLRLRPPQQSRRDPIAVNIPDVFSPEGKILNSDEGESNAALPAGRPPGAPIDPTPAAAPATAPAPAKPPAQDIAELFGEPEKRNWTPNEIVHKTTHLSGVAGAIIALQDGLLVAHCMPPTWNTETIAAFLPQIFGRMTQYSKELKMGELRSLTISVETGTLQVFNAGIIYFAALSKPDAPLPVRELDIIANELSRHTK